MKRRILGIIMVLVLTFSMSAQFPAAAETGFAVHKVAAKSAGDQTDSSAPGAAKDALADEKESAAEESSTDTDKKEPAEEENTSVPSAKRAPAGDAKGNINEKFTTADGITYQKIWGEDKLAVAGYTGDSGDVNIPASVVHPADGKEYPVTTIRQDLQGYKKIVNLTIPDSVTEIANSAFTGCVNLKSVKIGNGVKELTWTFKDCTSLSEVTLPGSLETIYGAFSGCSSLTELDLPEGLKELGQFSGTKIKEITIPESVTKIYDYGFSGCKELETIHLNQTITELGEQTFLGCDNLTTITGGKSITKIGDSCFGGYDYDEGEWVSDKNLTSIGDIDLSKVTSIGEYAFFNIPDLPYDGGVLNLDSVTNLGKYAFWNGQGIKEISTGDGLETIPENAFEYCYFLENVKIANGTKAIGNEAFGNADAATITIGSGNESKLSEIGENAFRDDADGSSITIHTAKSDVKLKDSSFGEKDTVVWTVESVDETGKVLYLNGTGGNDDNDGKTKETAVKSFERAKQLAAENPEITTIYVTGTAEVSGEISFDGTNAVLKRDESFDGYLLKVGSGKSAALKNITIDGNARKADAKKSLIYVDHGELDIEEGTILENNKIKPGNSEFEATGGAVTAGRESVVNMHDGTIRNNQATYGGGIYASSSVINMTGGEITGNRAVNADDGSSAAGGGIGLYVNDGIDVRPSVVNLKGGTISNNTSQEVGGGISLGYGRASGGHNILNMTGGVIDGNSAGSSGGGVFVQAGYSDTSSHNPSWGIANISGGNITNNVMDGSGKGNKAFGGGGIYVNGYSAEYPEFHNGVLNLTNAVISDNAASQEGGGYAGCPVSETHIYLKNGVALFGNSGSSANDLYILASTAFGAHSGNPKYTIADAMLGGAPYHWKYDDGTEVPLNRLEGELSALHGQKLALHTDEVGDENTNALAKVWITGNTSVTRGAGIGSNGTVNMGESELTTVSVNKTWEGDGGEGRPDWVELELYRTTQGSSADPVYVGYEKIRPDANSDWQLTFQNLPKHDAAGTLYLYTVKERTVGGYESTVSGDQTNGYTVLNTLKPDKTSVTVQKVWDDNGDQDGKRVEKIYVQLYADGEKLGKEVSLEEGNQWMYT